VTPPEGGRLESLLRRDRAVVAISLGAAIVVAWLALLHMAHHAGDDAVDMGGMPMAAWTGRDLGLVVVMWTVMMVGMMLPSAMPMTLLFARISRTRRSSGTPAGPTSVFVGAYLAVWAVFAVLAALGQLGLQRLALLSASALVAAPAVGGALLVVAGIYQVTPLKNACLSRCRSPLGFLLGEWREGWRGAFVMGARHGMVCVGCCWALMTVLFVVGVMNLAGVAAITAFVLLEKLAPLGRVTSWISGTALAAWGLYLLVKSLAA
jgi:predicted metal-binding membrane protein